MKSFLITLAALLCFGTAQLNAQDINVSSSIANAFHTTFSNAANVQWKSSGNYYKADFTMNDQYVSAYYDATATLVAVTKNISPVQLPVTLQTKLKQAYNDYWISELFELSNESGTTYYITLQDGDSKVVLKSIGNSWQTYQKQRKA